MINEQLKGKKVTGRCRGTNLERLTEGTQNLRPRSRSPDCTWSWDLPHTKCANNIRKPLFSTLGNSTSYPARPLSETGLFWDTNLIRACVNSGLQNTVDDKINSYLPILKMERAKSSEISVINYQYARHNITQGFNLHHYTLFPKERNWRRTSPRLYHLFLPILSRGDTIPPTIPHQ
jgi:hypothetical protein